MNDDINENIEENIIGFAKEKVNVCYAGWRVHAEKGDSKHLLDRMDKFYKDLWKGAK